MTRLILALVGVSFLQPHLGKAALPQEQREAFRHAVEDYQVFVVPHCTPYVVGAYAKARASRDRLFVRSLRGTDLEADYHQAVAERARLDGQRVYECMVPPPAPSERVPTMAEISASHAKEGDQQFAVMVRLRDRLLGHLRRRR